jgi:hypothetical protein
MIAKEYGQPPEAVAHWPDDWLAAAVTVMEAEAAASRERQIRDERRAKARRGR